MKKTLAELQRETVAGAAENRLISLFDEGSFVELDKYVTADGERTSVVGGYGSIDGLTVYAYAQDSGVKSGAMTMCAAQKIKKLYNLALKNGAPVIGFFDSKGGDIKEGQKLLAAYGDIAKASAKLSGVVPQIAVVDGICSGAAAMIACMADIVIMTEKSELFVTAPFLSKDKAENAGTAEGAAASGTAAIIAKDGDDAAAKAKMLLSVLPANNLETGGNDYFADNNAVVSDDLKGAALIGAAADKDSVITLYEKFGNAATTAIGSINWRTVGFVAVDRDSSMTMDDCAKIARFVTFCDAFSIPLVTFIDTDGFDNSSAAEAAGAIRDMAKTAQSYACATTPKIAVVTGHAIGSACVALSASGSDFTVAWEDAVISAASPEASVMFLNGASEPAEFAEQAKEYAENEASAFTAAQNGFVDMIITPQQTRAALISAIEAAANKRVISPAKKHADFVF